MNPLAPIATAWKRRALVGLVAAWGLLSLSVRAAETPVKAREVARGVWFVQGESALGSSANRNFVSNAGFVVTGKGVLVIDALGSPALALELISQIKRVTSQPVRWLIVTHYHADHVYGLQAFKALGVEIFAHPAAREYLNSDTAQRRLETSREELFPWIDERTVLVAADRWLEGKRTRLRLGGREIVVSHVGPSHTPEDLVVYVPDVGALFAGDLVFRGRIPFVGQADSRQWIDSLSALIDFGPSLLIPGHGPVSRTPKRDLGLTRDYLLHLRDAMGRAARDLEPFEEAYARADWSRFEKLPLFRVANRMNAYNTYLLMEQQAR